MVNSQTQFLKNKYAITARPVSVSKNQIIKIHDLQLSYIYYDTTFVIYYFAIPSELYSYKNDIIYFTNSLFSTHNNLQIFGFVFDITAFPDEIKRAILLST